MTTVDASNNPDKVKYYISETSSQIKSTKATPKLKVGDYVRKADKQISSLREALPIGIGDCLKLMKFLKHIHQHIN